MSADNWTHCPVCFKKDEASALLGLPDPTMREDWELGVDRMGNFDVNYRCYCKKCGFKWSRYSSENILEAK